MHEASVVEALYESAEATRTANGLVSVSQVRIRVGALQHIVDDVMQSYFALQQEQWPAFTGATLVINRLPARLRCLDCGAETELDEPVFACAACDSTNTELLSGDELDLVSLRGETEERT